MVGLSAQVVESVALTRQEGEPFLLDGNRLYFSYEKKEKHDHIDKIGCVDLSVSRKSFEVVEASEVPRWPEYRTINVDVRQVAFGYWLIEHAGYALPKEYLPVKRRYGSNVTGKLLNQITLSDFTEAMEQEWPCEMHQDQVVTPAFWWDISEGLITRAKSYAQEKRERLEARANHDWKPMRVLDASETASVLGIFSFDGDKKSLVSALLSWGVEIKDADVKVDKLLTKRIILPATLEELIPEPGQSI